MSRRWATAAVSLAVVALPLIGCGTLEPGSPPGSPSAAVLFALEPGWPAAGQTIQFRDFSTGSPSGRLWSFGDGETSSEANPTHVYSSAGTYTVVLSVSDSRGSSSSASVVTVSDGTFRLASSVAPDGGTLPMQFSCDGAGDSPDLFWNGAPAGTEEFALLMTTLPVDGNTKWNWVLYGIPATCCSLARNGSAVGVLGTGSHGTTCRYDPPCSAGPGMKLYTFTLYALAAAPDLPSDPAQVTGYVLEQAIRPLILGAASLSMGYARP